MALEARVLTFTAPTSTGDQDCTGPTFTPKVVIIWGSGVPNAADTFNNGFTFHYGFSDGTNTRCFNMIAEDNRPDSDTANSKRNDSLIYIISQTDTATLRARATFVSFLSNGVRINWATAPAAAFKFHILFLGGTDITNTKIGEFTLADDGVNGLRTVTGVGFQPDLLIMPKTTVDYVEGPTNVNTIVEHATFRVGMAANNSLGSGVNNVSVSVYSEDNLTATDSYQSQDNIYGVNAGNTVASIAIGTVTEFNSDGFVVDFTSTFVGATFIYPYLAIKGGSYTVGQITEPGSTGNQTVTTNKDVKAVQTFGIGTATNDGTAIVQLKFCVGGGISSTERVAAYVGDLDNVTTTATVSRYEQTALHTMCTPAATATSSTIDEECDLVSVSATNFVINWTNVGGAFLLNYITFGNAAAAAAAPEEISYQSYGNLFQNFDSNKNVIFG